MKSSEVPRQVHFLSQQADDQHVVVSDHVDNIVLAVVVYPDRWSILGSLSRHTWVLGDEGEGMAKLALVVVGLLPTKMGDAVEVAVDEVGIGLFGEPNFHGR